VFFGYSSDLNSILTITDPDPNCNVILDPDPANSVGSVVLLLGA